jgi:hypothetical protein
VDLVEGAGEIGFADGLIVDADALGGAHQMRTGEEACFVAGFAEAGFNHGADAAFTIGAGDMHYRAGELRVA